MVSIVDLVDQRNKKKLIKNSAKNKDFEKQNNFLVKKYIFLFQYKNIEKYQKYLLDF